jgi:Macrocin-O-methyltransferase (TylF)
LNTYSRALLLTVGVLVGIVFLFLGYKQKPSSTLSFPRNNFTISSSFKSFTHGVPIQSTNDGQLFSFPDELPLVRLYLDVVRDTVCGLTLRTQELSVIPSIEAKKVAFNLEKRIVGEDWAAIGITMIGQKRLINVEWAIRFVIANNVPGDFIECGVWRGGGSIFARAILKAFGIIDRHIWLVDSFQGLPKARTPNDHDQWEKQEYLKVIIRIFFCSIQ